MRRFAARTTVAKQFPARPILLDVGGEFSLEATVIPLDQIGAYLGDIAEAGQCTCPAGALQGARKNLRKGELLQPLAKLAGALSPRSLSGRSVRPVLRRESVQSVSPCRARKSFGKSTGH